MGGIQRASATIAAACYSAGHVVSYHAIFRQEHFFELPDGVLLDEPAPGRNERQLELMWTVGRLRRAVRQFQPDAVLVFDKFYSAVCVLALAGMRVPVFVSDRASPLYEWPRHVAAFNRIVFSLLRPAGVIAQTTIAARFQTKYFGARVPIRIIPNAVKPVEMRRVERKPWILAVGRLGDPLKGFDRLVSVFARLGDIGWKLVFAGSDDGDARLRSQVAALGLSERVEFRGAVRDMDSLYAESGIFCLPSRSEGFPNALAEAMMAALPCVCFNIVAGPRDLIENGVSGFLVPDGDLDGMAAVLRSLTSNPSQREFVGANAMVASRQCNPDVVTRRVLEFILPSEANG